MSTTFLDGSNKLVSVSAANPLPVTGGGGGGGGTEYTEDAAAPANPVGKIGQARRRDTLTAAEVSADGDIITLNATAKGEQYTKDTDVAAAIAATAVGTTAPGTAASQLIGVQGAGASALPINVASPGDVLSLTPVLDTAAYASGDTFFVTTSLPNAVRANDERCLLQSLAVIDKDDQKPAFTLFFFQTNVTFGTINAAPSISDSDAGNFLGSVAVTAADYVDLGGASVANIKNIGLLLESVSGARNVYVAAMLTAGTPTHTASGIILRFGMLWS